MIPFCLSLLQAHSRGGFVILQVMLECGEDFVKIAKVTGTDGKPDLLLSLDSNKIVTVGKVAIGKLLSRLQVSFSFESSCDLYVTVN